MSQENVEVVRSLYGLGGDAFLDVDADAADRTFRDDLDEQFGSACRPTTPRANRCSADAPGSKRCSPCSPILGRVAV